MALDKVKDDMLQDNLVFPGSTTQFPSITTTQRNALSGVQSGTLIYNSTVGKLQQYDGNNQWASIDSPPVITSITYPTESGAVLTALDADGGTEAAQTLIINGSNFSAASEIQVQIQVSGSYVAFASSISVNSAKTQITCTGVTKRAAADDYTLKVTNVTGLAATTTVNFSADPSFSTAANLGTVVAGTFTKSIAFTGIDVRQGATAKPTWMTVTGNAPSGSDANGAGATAFLATGTPIVLGGTAANTGTSQTHSFSIIVRDTENQTFNRDFSLTVVSLPIGGTITTYSGYRVHTFLLAGNGSATNNLVLYAATVCDILMVAGGGGGGYDSEADAGGGGAGGMRVITSATLAAGTYTAVVGDGGGAGTSSASPANGANTTFTGQTAATGGGAGSKADNGYAPGQNGGSGGGGGGENDSSSGQGDGGTGDGSVGTNGNTAGYYGGDGGAGNSTSGSNRHGGGGGGAGANGGAGSNSAGGAGAIGLQNNFRTGSNTFYAAGGGGGGKTAGTAGGSSIGGTGGNPGAAGTVGASNTGSGGGGGKNGSASTAKGGSGIIVVRYAV